MNYCQMWRSKLFSQCTIQVWITRGLLTCQCTFSTWHLVSNKDEFFVSCQNVFHTLPFQAWRYLTQKDRLNFSCHLLVKERTLTLKTMLSQTQCVILLIMFDPFRILQHKNFMTQSLLILFAPFSCSLCLLLGYVNQEKSSFAPDLRSMATRGWVSGGYW